MKRIKHTVEIIKSKYKVRNLEFMSDIYKNNRTKYETKCLKCRHIWQACPHNILDGLTNCPNCSGIFRYTIEDAREEFLKRNIKLLSTVYETCSKQLDIECLACGKKWKRSFSQQKHRKYGCPRCSSTEKLDIEFVRQEYLKRNIKFNGTTYENNSFKHPLICLKCRHEWSARFSDFYNSAVGCPRCAIEATKLTLDYVKKEYLKRDIELLNEDNYCNTKLPNDLKCLQCSWKWRADFGRLHSGHKAGCPNCCAGKNEKITKKTLEDFFPNLNIDKIKLNTFLIKPKKIICDFYFKYNSKEIIVEYNGQQHYKAIQFGNVSKEAALVKFEIQQRRDQWLRDYCMGNNIILIEIDGRKYTNDKIKPHLKEVLIKNNLISEATND